MKTTRMVVISAVFLCFLSGFYGQTSESEIPYSDDVPLTPNVRPVIVVSGTDLEMGYQWYQQIIQIYGKQSILQRVGREFTQEEKESLKAWDWYIKKHTPEMTDLLNGMLAAAKDAEIPLSYEELLSKWTGSYIIPPVGAREKLPKELLAGNLENVPECQVCGSEAESDCSGFAAWGTTTKGGKLICGGSGDHEIILGENEIRNFEYMLMMIPNEGNNFILSTSTGCCWHSAMNNKGTTMFHHGATGYCNRYKTPEEQDFGYGVPNNMITMHTLRYANSADEALSMILSLPSADGRIGGAWADVNGTAFVIENRENPRVIRRPGDNGETDFIYATNNLQSKQLGACYKDSPDNPVVFVEHAGWLATESTMESIPRNLGVWNLLHNYHGLVDLDFAKMMWRFAPDPAPRYESLEQADEDFIKFQGKTWNSHISETGNAMVGILMPDKGNEGRILVSQGTVARVSYPHWPGGRLFRIAPTYSFYELQLNETPERVADNCRTRARYELAYANQELRKLGYQDVAFAPLDALFNQAATDWQKGQYYFSRSRATEGNESVNFLAKATRAFTRVQAVAKQVHDSLVPPPHRPEDLGLRPWLGAWGDWAKRDGTPREKVQ